MIQIYFLQQNQAEAVINGYIGNLQSWLKSKMFSLNLLKTSYYIIFRPSSTADFYMVNIQFGHVKIHKADSIKFLSVWFHQNLSRNMHVSKLAFEITKSVGCLYKVTRLVIFWSGEQPRLLTIRNYKYFRR